MPGTRSTGCRRLAAAFAALALAGTAVSVASASAADSPRLRVSTREDRSSPTALNGRTLQGNIAIFVQPGLSTIERVAFSLDPGTSSANQHTEYSFPFDLAGTQTDGAATFVDTSRLQTGEHSVSAVVTFAGGLHQALTAQFIVGPSPAATASPPATPAPATSTAPSATGKLLFDFDERTPFTGDKSEQTFKYEYTPCSGTRLANDAQYASIVNDPAGVIERKTGAVRKVVKMTTPDTAGGGSDWGARCQLESWPILQEGGEYWEALSWYFPENFPGQVASPTWHMLHGSYGTNAIGNDPLRIDILNYLREPDGTLAQRIYMARGRHYASEVLWELKVGGKKTTVSDLRNRWTDVVLHYRIGRDKTGWLEIYLNVGNGWERQRFSPTTPYHTTSSDGYKVYYATADPLSNGEPPYDTRISNYYAYNSYVEHGFPNRNTGPTLYHGTHRAGTSFGAIDGTWSYANQAGAPSP